MTRSASMCNHCCYALTPIMWIAHLPLASTLKAYHGIIPDNLVGSDWGTIQAGNRAGKTQPRMQMGWMHREAPWGLAGPRFAQKRARAGSYANIVPGTSWFDSLLAEPLWTDRGRETARPTVSSNDRYIPRMISTWATLNQCTAALRAAAKAQSSSSKKSLFFCRKLASQTWTLGEGSLEIKLPTIWTDEKQSREEAERRERLEERRVRRRCRCVKR